VVGYDRLGSPELIDIARLADRLGVGERYVRRMVAERRVPTVKVGRLDRVDLAEIRRWIEEQRRPGRYQASYWHEGLRQIAEQTFATKGDALALLPSIEADLRRGTRLDPPAGKVTLGAWGTRWLVRTDLLGAWSCASGSSRPATSPAGCCGRSSTRR
jgi:excisionase family DNA binding protein